MRSRSHKIQVNPRNPAKFTKTRKIPQNSVKILSNTCLYNIFETYLSYWGYLHGVNLQIYLEPSSLRRANKVPKLRGVDYVAKTRLNQIPAKWADFSANLSLKIPRNLLFFPRPIRSPDLSWENLIKDQRMFSLWWSNYYWFHNLIYWCCVYNVKRKSM